MSSAELALQLSLGISNTNYHVKALARVGALVLTDQIPVRGAEEHFYASTLSDDDLVLALLERSKDEDESPPRDVKRAGLRVDSPC